MRVNKEDLFIAIMSISGAVFIAVLLWNMLVVNHRENVQRDEFYATHCHTVKQEGLLTNKFTCAPNN